MVLNQRISVISICFNNEAELTGTCASVDGQTVKPYEHIIIDGSTEPAIKNVLENTPQPVYRKWISEKDDGISDAFNKGIEMASGDYIQFLNSGDSYTNSSVLEMVLQIMAKKPANWYHGKLRLFRGGHWVEIGKPFDPAKIYRGMRATFHPTMFVKRSLFEQTGGFDTRLKIAMDYDFLLRIRNEKNYFIPETIVYFNPDGISNSSYVAGLHETKQCYEKYCGKSFRLTLWQFRLRCLYYLLQTPVGKLLYRFKKKLKLENI
jgi:GT2 family glycosyltransferase